MQIRVEPQHNKDLKLLATHNRRSVAGQVNAIIADHIADQKPVLLLIRRLTKPKPKK